MLIDDKHKAIFLHITKTGGMSVEKGMGYKHLPQYHKHTSEKIRINRKKWDEYFKFTFVRNPYDRVLSAFKFHMVKIDRNENVNGVKIRKKIKQCCYGDFEGFVLGYLEECYKSEITLKPQINWVNCGVDFIGRFESFQEDYKFLKDKLNFPNELPHINKSFDSDYVYTSEMYEIVNRAYKEDFEVLGYELKW